MPDDAKTTYVNYIDYVWGGRHREALAGYYAPGFVDHLQLPGMPAGLDGVLARFDALFAGFPDARFEVVNCVGEAEKVAVLLRLEATQTGEFMGVPPTGNRVAVLSFDITRFEGNKIVEHWELFDSMSMMQQLGLAPSPEENPHAPGATSTDVFSVGEDSGDL